MVVCGTDGEGKEERGVWCVWGKVVWGNGCGNGKEHGEMVILGKVELGFWGEGGVCG